MKYLTHDEACDSSEPVGIEVEYKNGNKDWYDPVNYDEDFKEMTLGYSIHNGYGRYYVSKEHLKSIRPYKLEEE